MSEIENTILDEALASLSTNDNFENILTNLKRVLNNKGETLHELDSNSDTDSEKMSTEGGKSDKFKKYLKMHQNQQLETLSSFLVDKNGNNLCDILSTISGTLLHISNFLEKSCDKNATRASQQ